MMLNECHLQWREQTDTLERRRSTTKAGPPMLFLAMQASCQTPTPSLASIIGETHIGNGNKS